ncbi:MAG TPA: immune inhibitor A domain-containing protein [Nocardioidaceae bacterium]|nr:immune inhibitor A domain-containing protein [Nocardioidaceae bacterium]
MPLTMSRSLSRKRVGGIVGSVTLSVGLLATLGPVDTASASGPAAGDDPSPIVPVDEQVWEEQAHMTWDDYKPIRPDAWNSAETSQGSDVQYKTAVILMDFKDQPFLITQKAGSHAFGNPQAPWDPVPQDQVNQWFNDYYAVPNQYNGGQTLHGYWMEDSHGRIGVDVEVFGPYKMPYHWWQYGLSEWGATDIGSNACPAQSDIPTGGTDVTNLNVETTDFFYVGDKVTIRHDAFDDDAAPDPVDRNVVAIPDDHTLVLDQPVPTVRDGARVHDCDLDIRTDGGAAWRNDIGCDQGLCGFDNGFYVTAGHDESSTWQEFGEMKFEDKEDVPDVLGNPNPALPNWAATRYVEWTSWLAAANHWPNAGGGTSTQAESSGLSVFAHEFSHLRNLPDNYNNPFAEPDQATRAYTGYWEMMSRGSFNGPGGTHNRWQIPNAGGSALGPHHMLHFKSVGNQRLGVVRNDEQVILERNELPQQGIAVTTIKAREYVPGNDNVGLTVNLGAGGFTPGTCRERVSDAFWCTPNLTTWQRFTMEVVDRVGNDSFTAGHGVLLAQTKDSGTPREWVVDANPEDIHRVDFVRPDGTVVPVVRGDPRQLDDATFQAGTDSGSLYEYVDAPNNLHFYVLDAYRNANGVLYYDIAVRNLQGAGNFNRNVALGDPATFAVGNSTGLVRVPLTNTGTAGAGLFDSDVYRLSTTVDGDGWSVHLPYEVKAVAAGDTVTAPIYATAGDGASESATVTITATSEADPSKSATTEIELTSTDVKVSFDGARGLVDAYAADGDLNKTQQRWLKAKLTVAERGDQDDALEALDQFSTRVSAEVRDVLAKAALLSVADDLRDLV